MTEIPRFKSEDEERDFWAIYDSADFLDGAEQVNLERITTVSGASPSKWEEVSY